MRRGDRVSLKQPNEKPGMARIGVVIDECATAPKVTVKWDRGGIQTLPVEALDKEPKADRYDELDMYHNERRRRRF